MNEFPKNNELNPDDIENEIKKEIVTQCPHCNKFFGENSNKQKDDPDFKKKFEISHITCSDCASKAEEDFVKSMEERGFDPEETRKKMAAFREGEKKRRGEK